jgi:hypothetical protein
VEALRGIVQFEVEKRQIPPVDPGFLGDALERIACVWAVGMPRLIDSQQTAGGSKLTWAVHLTAPPGARLTLAMHALREVVASATAPSGGRSSG